MVDVAEIPTLQDRPDGGHRRRRYDRAGRAAGPRRRGLRRSRQRGRSPPSDGHRLVWTVASSTFDYAAGAGGLDVSRLRLRAHRAGHRAPPAPSSQVEQRLPGRPGRLARADRGRRRRRRRLPAAGDQRQQRADRLPAGPAQLRPRRPVGDDRGDRRRRRHRRRVPAAGAAATRSHAGWPGWTAPSRTWPAATLTPSGRPAGRAAGHGARRRPRRPARPRQDDPGRLPGRQARPTAATPSRSPARSR